MDVKMEKVEPNFKPRNIVIRVESEIELDVLRKLASTNVSVPTAVFGEKGYWGSSTGKNEKYEVLYDFLGQLHRQVREWRPDVK